MQKIERNQLASQQLAGGCAKHNSSKATVNGNGTAIAATVVQSQIVIRLF